jgi:hypothetical protein
MIAKILTTVQTEQTGQFLHQCCKLGGLWVLLAEVAEEYADAFPRHETGGYPARLGADGKRLGLLIERFVEGDGLLFGNRLDHLGKRRSEGRRGDRHATGDRQQQIVGRCVDDAELRALLRRLAQPLRKQWVILAQEAANHQHPVEPAEFRDRGSQPWRPRPLAIEREITLAQAEIDVVGHIFERGLPIHFQPLAVLLDHRARQALSVFKRLVREAITIRNPAFVDFFVLERQYAHHGVVLDLNHQICPRLSCGLTVLRRDNSQVRAE